MRIELEKDKPYEIVNDCIATRRVAFDDEEYQDDEEDFFNTSKEERQRWGTLESSAVS